MRPCDRPKEYHCPGEPGAISRSVHLARLADGYPACRRCPLREDTEGLSERTRRRIPPAEISSVPRNLFDDEGAVGGLHAGFDARLAGRIGAAFGIVLRERSAAPDGSPTVVVGNDGRSLTQPHFWSALEGLRWAGCDVLEMGPAPCPALAWSVARLDADAGLHVGNPSTASRNAGIRLFLRGGQPIGTDALSQTIGLTEQDRVPRPVRRSGAAGRADTLCDYERSFAPSFHGLRPLRFRLFTTCGPFARSVARLLEETACTMVLENTTPVPEHQAIACDVGHFALAVSDDGRSSHLWDERGRPVGEDRLVYLLIRRLFAGKPAGNRVVLGEGAGKSVGPGLEDSGVKIVRCGPGAATCHGTMVHCGAAFGVEGAGRLWYRTAEGWVGADALVTLTMLLEILSTGDRSLSEVLDGAEAGG